MNDLIRSRVYERELRRKRKLNMVKQKGMASIIIFAGVICTLHFKCGVNDKSASGVGAFYLIIIVGILLFVTNDNWYAKE